MIIVGTATIEGPAHERRARARAVFSAWLDGRALIYDERGAPTLPGSRLFVSASHSEDKLLMALADRPLGIDLERVRPVTAAFARWLGFRADSPPAPVLARWTAIEAYWKARGEGVGRRPLEAITRTSFAGWQVRELATFDGFVASLAVPDSSAGAELARPNVDTS